MIENLKLCPFCGHRIIEKITSGIHFYECENPDCGACISFVGKKIKGRINGVVISEAENPREHFNRRTKK